MIAIVDTGGANHASIQNALARLGETSRVTADPEQLEAASHLILPGVGHAAHAMRKLTENNLIGYLREQNKPTLGICLGLQILFDRSEEGEVECLGLLPGAVSLLAPGPEFRVPHMGWAQLERTPQATILLQGIEPSAYFYFVHSYRVPNGEWTTAVAKAPVALPAVVEFKNILATQFHPERSSQVGAKVLRNFLAWGREEK